MRQQFDPSDVALAVKFLSGEGLLKHTTQKQVKFYELSSKALEMYRPSKFKRKSLSSIQIDATNSVIVAGDNLGTITQNNTEGIQDIDNLIEALKASDASQDEKREIVADLETIKTQLLKKQPNGGIIKAAWGAVRAGVGAVPTLTTAAGYVERVGHFLSIWL